MKRSNEPIFWSLFGAGGLLAALIGPALVFITGIAVPLVLMNPDTMSYAHMLAFYSTGPANSSPLPVTSELPAMMM